MSELSPPRRHAPAGPQPLSALATLARAGWIALALSASAAVAAQEPAAAIQPAAAQEPVATPQPLQEFGALAIGVWQDATSWHVLEWTLGETAIRSRSYSASPSDSSLVSEGLWFWDPSEETIRGVVVAQGMPIELFEYRSEVRGGRIVHDLEAHGPAGGRYIETWIFEGDGYRWTLEQEVEGSPALLMDGAYRRSGGIP
ncbi:MAG: hypothetical protein KJP18_14725 [Gemmatimonadetes bacterium]|nr:hypothetical protein [Gemmatimonadota bacterium]